MAELVDALASEVSESNLVEVQVLSSAPKLNKFHLWDLFNFMHEEESAVRTFVGT